MINKSNKFELPHLAKLCIFFSFRYQCEPTSLTVEAVQMYDEAQIGNSIHGKYAKPPVPIYLEDDTNDFDEHSKIYDTCYHLLKLYANDAHSLEQTLSPTTSTVNHLDYRLR